MNNTTLNEWISFAHVVEEKGFTNAAKKLGLSPSIISKRIKQLEKNLGARLLQRSTRNVVLTETGKLFYEHCQRIKKEVEQARFIVAQSQKMPGGTLRIYAPMSLGQTHLSSVISQFIKHYPDIQIALQLGNRLPNLIEEELDIAISIKELPDSALIAKRLASRSIGIYGSLEYFNHYGIPKTPEELSSHNCLLYHHAHAKQEWQFIDAHQKIFAVNVNGNFRVNSSQALAKAAIAGLGIAKLPSFMVNEEVQQKKLVRILKEYCRQNIGIYAIYPHKTFVPEKTRLFIHFLTEHFAAMPDWEA